MPGYGRRYAATAWSSLMPANSAQGNPYRSPASETERKLIDPLPRSPSPWRWALAGALWSVVSTFPVAAITALLFRFPVPFAGYLSGINAVVPAMIAALFYGVLFGGLLLLGGLRALGGFVAATTMKHDQRRSRLFTLGWSLLVTTTGVLTLAILDKIIGPW